MELPPFHLNCRCTVIGIEEKEEKEGVEYSDEDGIMELTRNKNSTPRKIGAEGQQIIDTPTYNKLTEKFLKNGGIIIRGKEAEDHLRESGAYASYLSSFNAAVIKDEATVSDVLEEMYHAEQDRKNMFGNVVTHEVKYRREIDAQKYLLSLTDKYNIPEEEVNVTRANLANYERLLKELLEGSD